MSADPPLWQRWKSKVEAELAGQPFDKLATRLPDGSTLAPLYPGLEAGLDLPPAARTRPEPELAPFPVAGAERDLDLRPLEQSGAAPAEELAALLVAAHDDPAIGVIHLGLSPDILMQIAKLRAARRLVARLVELDGQPRTPILHAHTSLRSFTRFDPWVNLLRNAASVFAALLGGADRVTPVPYDVLIGEPDEDARRLADHTVRIALHEAHLGASADPTLGSFALEALTEDLCRRAWTLADEQSQAAKSDAKGPLQRHVAQTAAARAQRIATRQDGLIGTSLYPDLDEPALSRPAHSPDSPAGPLISGHRLALPFERLRRAGLAQGARVFLATFGPLARHTARATWVAHLCAAGGLRPIDLTPPTAEGYPSIEAVAAAFSAAGTPLAILCLADSDWGESAEHLSALGQALVAKGATVLVAGRPLTTPPPTPPPWSGFIHAGQSALDVLTDLHLRLGLAGDAP